MLEYPLRFLRLEHHVNRRRRLFASPNLRNTVANGCCDFDSCTVHCGRLRRWQTIGIQGAYDHVRRGDEPSVGRAVGEKALVCEELNDYGITETEASSWQGLLGAEGLRAVLKHKNLKVNL